MKKMRVGIVGCGTIGVEIAKACCGTLKHAFRLVSVCETERAKIVALKRQLDVRVKVLDIDSLIGSADLIVEAASGNIAPIVLEKCISRDKDCLIMSVGGLLGKEHLLMRVNESGMRLYLPSGALCGIDGLKSASVGKIRSVTLTTRKPPKAFTGAPFLVARGILASSIKKERILFAGSAAAAVKIFPQNINVAAVLSLAGIGARKTRVRIIADPSVVRNIHEVEVIGESGRLAARTENVPSMSNPKTSALAVYSAIATLRAIADRVRIGT